MELFLETLSFEGWKWQISSNFIFFLASCLKFLSFSRLTWQGFPHNLMIYYYFIKSAKSLHRIRGAPLFWVLGTLDTPTHRLLHPVMLMCIAHRIGPKSMVHKKITCQICFDLENTYDCFGGRRSWLCLVAWICGRALLLPFMMVIYFSIASLV